MKTSIEFPLIETERLILRKITESDIPEVFRIFSTDEVTEHYDCYPFTKESQAEKWVDRQLSSYKAKGINGFRWAVSKKDLPTKLIGSCGFHSVNRKFKSIEIGYELHPDYWGRGFATEAVAGFISFCFVNQFPFKVNRIAATTDIVNPLSISVLKKLGFAEEGILREYGFWKGKFHDSV